VDLIARHSVLFQPVFMMKTSTKVSKEVAAKTAVESVPAKNGPIKTFRIDDVSCSVWARTIVRLEPITMYSVSYQRSYRNARGEWAHSQYFNLADLPKIVTLSKDAEEFIHEEMRQAASDRAAGEQEAE
jgi:hypothetical protein